MLTAYDSELNATAGNSLSYIVKVQNMRMYFEEGDGDDDDDEESDDPFGDE